MAQQTGLERVGLLLGATELWVAEPGFKPVSSFSSGCLRPDLALGTEHTAVSLGGEDPNLLEAIASFSTFFLPVLLPNHQPSRC